MIETIIVVSAQSLIIIGLLIDRHFYTRHMTRQLENANKAVMSRNITDYLTATKEERSPTSRQEEPDEIPLGDLSDQDFDSFIQKQN